MEMTDIYQLIVFCLFCVVLCVFAIALMARGERRD